jgi:hypothetical protein
VKAKLVTGSSSMTSDLRVLLQMIPPQEEESLYLETVKYLNQL